MSGPADASLHEPDSALAASLRHTLTVERQNRVVGLRKVNILAAAPTDWHAGDASRMADIIYPILWLVWSRSPPFPRAGGPPEPLPESSERYGCGRFGVRDRFRFNCTGMARRKSFRQRAMLWAPLNDWQPRTRPDKNLRSCGFKTAPYGTR